MAQRMALEMQHRHFQMMSDMMRQAHETRMIMISNMGGNTRYEYRWR